jgi:hypothetical protein
VADDPPSVPLLQPQEQPSPGDTDTGWPNDGTGGELGQNAKTAMAISHLSTLMVPLLNHQQRGAKSDKKCEARLAQSSVSTIH